MLSERGANDGELEAYEGQLDDLVYVAVCQ
jgi:hypothetical protein